MFCHEVAATNPVLNSGRMPAGGEAQAADDVDAEAPAAKRRKGRKGKKVAARAAEPASSPGAYDIKFMPAPCRQKPVCMHACAMGTSYSSVVVSMWTVRAVAA